MDSLHALLLAEHDKVLQQIDVLEKRIKAAPEGKLYISKYTLYILFFIAFF